MTTQRFQTIQFTRHVLLRATERGISRQDILDTIRCPRISYESKRYPGSYKYHGRGFTVVVKPENGVGIIITLLRDGQPE